MKTSHKEHFTETDRGNIKYSTYASANVLSSLISHYEQQYNILMACGPSAFHSWKDPKYTTQEEVLLLLKLSRNYSFKKQLTCKKTFNAAKLHIVFAVQC